MKRFSLFLFVFLAGTALLAPNAAYAQSAAEIQAQIDANNAQVKALQEEIAKYQKELDALGDKRTTLQSAVNSLALSQKQLAAQIKVTESKIVSANLQIKELTNSIGDKERTIDLNKQAIARALARTADAESVPLVGRVLSANSLSDAWEEADEAFAFNRALSEDIEELRAVRAELTDNRDEVTKTKESLLSLQRDLALQKRSVDANKASQQQLLTQTKNQEANYQQIISAKQAAQKSFEQELVNLQGQLNLIVNPALLPKVGTGVLSWPFSVSYMNNCAQRKKVFGNLFCITQYFGNTPFSTANPQVYNGKGHGGVDFSAPIGTPLRAALSGTVLGTGNTDLVRDSAGRQCYSYGKWVVIVHGNGVSTLYAHLSTIDVAKGQSVSTGQVVGLSGSTGYATGPHLHFAVYATDGMQITTLQQLRQGGSPCANAVMPVARIEAYLNPLSYL